MDIKKIIFISAVCLIVFYLAIVFGEDVISFFYNRFSG